MRLAIVFLVWFFAAKAAAADAPPNVVFILADDLGWTDLACYGSDFHETPHLDRLAREGVRFTHAYAMSVCTPSRAAILSGRHAARLHMTVWREASFNRGADAARSKRRLLPPASAHDLAHHQFTLAEALKAAGYLTFHIGKWHLGDAEHSPESAGFDLNIGGTHWGAPNTFFWPFSGTNTFREFRYVPGLGLGKPGDYLTDRLTDEALKLIDTAEGRPFFLNLWFHNPHTPIEGKPAVVQHYQRKVKQGLRHRNPDYAAMIHALDQNVGRILARLEERHLAARTLVIFTSDNGGYVNQFRGRQVTDNAPLRSGKGSLYEGGIRVPLMVRLPGVTALGSVCHEPVVCMDFRPTIRELCGIGGDESSAEDTASDGMSFVSLLTNPGARLQRDALFFHYPHYYPTTTPVGAVRSGDWKLLEYFEDHRVELYDLRNDPGETRDLAAEQPERASELGRRLQAWRAEAGAQLPVPNPAFQSRSGASGK